MNTQITAKVVADSVNERGNRITTLQLMYPRFIHAELLTHRQLSRNSSSSRAIPVAKMIAQVRDNPAMPVHWGANQPGMQAREEIDAVDKPDAAHMWRQAANAAADWAERMMNLGLHKQVANRILEPFQLMHTVVTATEWDNFFTLRDHPDADPNIRALAVEMRLAMDASEPVLRQHYGKAAWHLPYTSDEDRGLYDLNTLCKISTARCARVSYLTHDGLTPDVAKDIELHDRLMVAEPRHASPAEHVAVAAHSLLPNEYTANFVGWRQYRHIA